MMHVLQLANFYGERSGGLRVAVDRLADEYVATGHRCTLVIPDDHDEVSGDDARMVIRVKSPRLPLLGGYRAIVDGGAVRAVIDTVRPDVIELSDKVTLPHSARWARQRGIPTVLFSHERLDDVIDAAIWTGGLGPLAGRAVARRLAGDVDAIVCASRYAAAEFDAIGAPVNLIPLGVDLERFRPDPAVRRAAPPLIVCAVRLSVEKQPWLVVETSRRLVERGVDHRLTIFGDGPLRRRLALQASGLPIVFKGHVNDRPALAAAMAAADVAIAPGPLETFGLAALELLASGTPVVVPAHGALSELIVPGTGIAAVSHADAFADGIELLLAGDRSWQREATRARAEQFTWRATADRMLEVFERVVALRLAGTCSPVP